MSHTKVGGESRVRRVTKQDHDRRSFPQSPGSFGQAEGGERRSERAASFAGSLTRLRDVPRDWAGEPSPFPPERMITEQQPLPAALLRPRLTRRAACWYLNVVGTCLYSGGNFSG